MIMKKAKLCLVTMLFLLIGFESFRGIFKILMFYNKLYRNIFFDYGLLSAGTALNYGFPTITLIKKQVFKEAWE